uniref:CWH43-like N-terminal domain-containing protein n=1 Tax=Globodera rostochiensis TaxID=31243 RepID=A0A914HTG1_GLORO
MAAHNGHHQHHQLPSAFAYPDEFSRVAHHRNEQAKRSKLKVLPASKEEHRAIKEAFNFEEDDNEDIAYLNFPLIWPVGIVSALSVGFFLFAFSAMELNDHLSFERYALNQLLYTYGKTLGFCNNTMPYERGMWPSFLRQVEMKVFTNVCFRVAVCVPMSIRIFVAFIIRNSGRSHSLVLRNALVHYLNEMSAGVAVVEVFSLSLFSIVTIRFDYAHFYNAMFGTFILSATFYMFLRTMLSFTADDLEPIEQLAGAVRLVCCILFTWTASQVFQTHQRFIHHTGCHGYVRPGEAMTEYIAIVAYAVFSLLQLVDIRNVRFICYPRSCSGECEPLRPDNFQPGAKFEHCRAFEWIQRNSGDNKNWRQQNVSPNGPSSVPPSDGGANSNSGRFPNKFFVVANGAH